MRGQSLVMIVIAAGLAACAGSFDSGGNGSGSGGQGDAGAGSCSTVITFNPVPAYADPVAPIRAEVNVVGAPGVFTYTWSVTFQGNPVAITMEASDNSQIGFIAPDAGPYYVAVQIDGGTYVECRYANAVANVLAPGANIDNYRLRTVPPPTVAPPQEQIIQVAGGADFVRAIALDPGIAATGTVRSGSVGGPIVAAYLKFMPVAAPYAFTETFTTNSSGFSTRLLGQTHDVLVIPTSTSLAPRLATWTPSTTELVVTGGTVVSGVVRNQAGTGFGGAKVQLMSGGVPSTLATTAADGSFSLRTSYPANAMITVKVTPPAATGLPRLEAIGQFDLAQSMQITYASTLQTCNLQSTPVRRNSVAQAGAKVTVVGTLPVNAGTVQAGVAANASGSVRIAASADGSGLLPSMLVPRAALTAVTELASGEYALSALDTSACVGGLQIDAPPLVDDSGVLALAGVRVEATPVGELALADAQPISTTSDETGAFTLPLAAGGRYDVRFIDPQARVAQLTLANVLAGSIPALTSLPSALRISGKVSVAGSTQPVVNTSVQLLCAACTGIEATRPVAQTATTSVSEYQIAVPDPGTM